MKVRRECYLVVDYKELENLITHVLSEWLNDNAPIGEEHYRKPAIAVIEKVREFDKNKKLTKDSK